MTDEHSIRGTVAYMAPEQLANSRDAGPAVDLFACGGCLLRLMTGRIPNVALKPKVADSALAEATYLPDALRDVIRKAIRHSPKQRFQTAEEFAEALFPFHRRE